MLLKTSWSIGLSSILLAGCGLGMVVPAIDPVIAVKERAKAYYHALATRDFKTTYELHPPSYRSQYNYESHIIKGVHWVTYVSSEVLSVTCATDNMCNVDVELSYSGVQVGKGGVKGVVKTLVSHKWGKVDGVWFMCENVSCK